MNRGDDSVAKGSLSELRPLMTNYSPDHDHARIRQDTRFTLIKDRLSLDEVLDIFISAIESKSPAYYEYQSDSVTGTCAEIAVYENIPTMISKPSGLWGWNGCYIVFDTINNKHYLMATNNTWKIEMAGECYKCKHGCKMPERCPLFEAK